jgi:hypothetical protein
MPNFVQNILMLALCWLLTAGAGVYMTFVKQPEKLETVTKAEQVARLRQSEVSTLLAEAASSEEMAQEAVKRWNSRYKVIPSTLSSPEVVGYLNHLTGTGFKNFDISLKGTERKPDYGLYTFEVRGRAYFTSLYRFVWDIENNRFFYRIRDLNLDHIDLMTKERGSDAERMEIMVSFSMAVDAYFGGPDGSSAPELSGDSGALPVAATARAPVPLEVLPSLRPANNPFFPIVMDKLPPNTRGLVDVETATLVAVSGGTAAFLDEKGFRMLSSGDEVYLGRITSINAQVGRVMVRMNKGGILDEVELNLHRGERFHNALGSVRQAPIHTEE